MIAHNNAIIIKTPEQIEGIKKSCILAANALKFAESIVEIGMSTETLDNKIHEYISDHHGTPAALNYMGFPKSTCISINEVVCHGIPSPEDIIQDGDLVKIDIATILDGYYGDNCTTVMVGNVSSEARRLTEITKVALYMGIDQCKNGGKFGNIGHVINKFAVSKGFSTVVQYSGHGVGIRFHEAPTICHSAYKNTGETIRPGMVFTIEPMLNCGVEDTTLDKKNKWTVRTVDNKLSAQFEHTILVNEYGPEILTLPNK